jgi:hypothetical protein
MGNHFVAQRHLRGFQSPGNPGFIWMFDKVQCISKQLPISKVAQAANFYPKETELELTFAVEVPGLNAVEKLVAGGQLDEGERRDLTYYIASQMKRVPRARIFGEGLVPGVIDRLTSEHRTQVEGAAKQGWIEQDGQDVLLGEIEFARQKMHQSTPEEVLEQINAPWPYESWLVSIHSMNWRLLKRPGPLSFLISDNPAYFFPSVGMGPPMAS